MTGKHRSPRSGPAQGAGRYFRLPPRDFYTRPVVHLDCRGRTEVEGCRAVLEYDAGKIRLDLGGRLLTLYGDELVLEGISRRTLQIRGQILRAELSAPQKGE